DLAYLEKAGLTHARIGERLRDLQELAPFQPLAEKTTLGERFMFLDSTQLIRRRGLGFLESLGQEKLSKEPNADADEPLARIDWEPALKDINQWFTRIADALNIKDRTDREKSIRKIEMDLDSLKKEVVKKNELGASLAKRKFESKELSEAMGKVLISLLLPATLRLQPAYDRTEQTQQNLYLAFALAAYHSDHKAYPAKLDDLAPKYLSCIPKDLFTGKPMIYRPANKGYLLYSVGVNGKDENGQTYGDDPPGDDIVVRMPLPELKPKK
ncbi:MAG TPA: hypothetical protein VGZ25_03865, partial [Gemmataceae bacterium]|nr:hypothetical protein [Gemmataceae bacterium]